MGHKPYPPVLPVPYSYPRAGLVLRFCEIHKDHQNSSLWMPSFLDSPKISVIRAVFEIDRLTWCWQGGKIFLYLRTERYVRLDVIRSVCLSYCYAAWSIKCFWILEATQEFSSQISLPRLIDARCLVPLRMFPDCFPDVAPLAISCSR